MAGCKTCGAKRSVKYPTCKGTGPYGSVQCNNGRGSGVVQCGACTGKGCV